MQMITLEWAQRFAEEWVAAWNAHDLERVFQHYDDDFTFSSPVIVALDFGANGTLRGKSAMRPYWTKGLALQPPIRFEIVSVFAGIDCVSISYRSIARKLVCETFFFNEENRVVRSTATYGESAGD